MGFLPSYGCISDFWKIKKGGQMERLKSAVLDSLPVALWIGASAAATYLLTTLMDKPELAPYYGLLNLLLVLVRNLKK